MIPNWGGFGERVEDYYQFVPVDWQKTREPNTLSPTNSWVTASGDPEANFKNRFPKKAVIIATGKTALEGIKEENDDQEEGLYTVAYRTKGEVYAGVLPDGFGEIEPGRDSLAAVAIHQVRSPSKVSMGIYYKSKNTIYLPFQTIIFRQLVPISSLAEQFNDMPLVSKS
jgi:hypothetical protein